MIELTEQEREELTRWSTSRTLAAGDVFKAKLILALSNGVSYSRIEAELKTSRPTIARWKRALKRGASPDWRGTIREAAHERQRQPCRHES